MKYFEHLGHIFFENKIKVITLKLVYVLGKLYWEIISQSDYRKMSQPSVIKKTDNELFLRVTEICEIILSIVLFPVTLMAM